MERYKRAYRDPNSPLTPLTPLTNNVFNFNVDAAEQALVPHNQQLDISSPISTGIAILGNLFQRKRGYRLGTASASPSTSGNRKRTQSFNGKENTPMAHATENDCRYPVPPLRQKRYAIKQEQQQQQQNENIPQINIIPPPRRKRNPLKLQLNNSDDYETELDVTELSQDQNFIRQQQQQLQQYQNRKPRFNASNVRLSSPVPPKPLSPRLGAFLASWGMNCLKSIFERQEIDMETFCCLTSDDLELLGIEDHEKRELVLKAVDFLKNNLKKD